MLDRKRVVGLLAGVALSLAAGPVVHADTVTYEADAAYAQVFGPQGPYPVGTTASLQGTVDFDPSTEQFSDPNLTVVGPESGTFTTVVSQAFTGSFQGSPPTSYAVQFSNPSNPDQELVIGFPVGFSNNQPVAEFTQPLETLFFDQTAGNVYAGGVGTLTATPLPGAASAGAALLMLIGLGHLRRLRLRTS